MSIDAYARTPTKSTGAASMTTQFRGHGLSLSTANELKHTSV